VPASGGGLWLVLPPPQAGINVSKVNSIINASPRCRRFVPARKIAGKTNPMAIIHLLPEVRRNCALTGAVVLTVTETLVVAAVPFAAMDAGLKAHFDSEGSPEQAKLIVPLKPLEFMTLIDVLPTPPGAEMVTVDSAELTVAKKPGVIVKLWDWVVLLGWKLGSPL
jgi:hypothetical protein